jgi:hypothetical protein
LRVRSPQGIHPDQHLVCKRQVPLQQVLSEIEQSRTAESISGLKLPENTCCATGLIPHSSNVSDTPAIADRHADLAAQALANIRSTHAPPCYHRAMDRTHTQRSEVGVSEAARRTLSRGSLWVCLVSDQTFFGARVASQRGDQDRGALWRG